MTHSEEDLQLLLDTFAKAYKKLGLALNIKRKTQILYQSPPNTITPASPPNIYVDKTRLKNVGHFNYLGSFLSSIDEETIDEEVNHYLSSASREFSRLRKMVFENRDL